MKSEKKKAASGGGTPKGGREKIIHLYYRGKERMCQDGHLCAGPHGNHPADGGSA
jgi:hypothetical protein